MIKTGTHEREVRAGNARPALKPFEENKHLCGQSFINKKGWWMLFPRPIKAGNEKVPKTISRDFETLRTQKKGLFIVDG